MFVYTFMFLVRSNSETALNYVFLVSLIRSSFLGFVFYYINTFSMSDESCSHRIRLEGGLTCDIKNRIIKLVSHKRIP